MMCFAQAEIPAIIEFAKGLGQSSPIVGVIGIFLFMVWKYVIVPLKDESLEKQKSDAVSLAKMSDAMSSIATALRTMEERHSNREHKTNAIIIYTAKALRASINQQKEECAQSVAALEAIVKGADE